MAEYINKAELIDTLFRGYTTEEFEDNIGEIITKEIIERLPTIDIVRCKDCKHYDKFIRLCDIGHSACRLGWFCADGKRKG